MIQLTKNLLLTFIGGSKYSGNKILTVACYFEFFGEEGVAYISTENLNKESASYKLTEISYELADSFNSLIKDDKNWQKISGEAKRLLEKWKLDYNLDEKEN